ncbi:unnamed protein product, partial [marine sediment metagenome]
PSRYKWSDNDNKLYLPTELAHHKWRIKASDASMGISPMYAALMPASVALAGMGWARDVFENAGLPVTTMDFSAMAADQLSSLINDPNLTAQIKQQYKDLHGGVMKSGELHISPAKVSAISWKINESGVLEISENAEGQIARNFGVNPLSIGDTDKASYSNLTEITKTLVVYTCGGRLQSILDDINLMFRPMFPGRVLYIDWKMVAEAQEDEKIAAEIASMLVTGMCITPDQGAERAGFEPQGTDGKTRIAPMTMGPLSMATGGSNHG